MKSDNNNNNKRKSDFLGMSHSKAAARLRKSIMFRLVQETHRDICIRCNEVIQTAQELSIEHIKPWQYQSVELFWDLDNIAFSHLKCNVPHVRKGGGVVKHYRDEDSSWCNICKDFHSKERFTKDASNWNGLKRYCKEQRKIHRYRLEGKNS